MGEQTEWDVDSNSLCNDRDSNFAIIHQFSIFILSQVKQWEARTLLSENGVTCVEGTL
jgi:hypothetical protein